MQITHNGKTYKWIGNYWGEKDITDVGKISVTYGEVGFTDQYQGILRTYHTPEQLVKLGYMELIEEYIEGDIRIAEMLESPSEPIYTKEETKPVVENALPLFDRTGENKGYKMEIKETKPCEHKPCTLPGGKIICCDCEKEIEKESEEIWGETKPEEKPQFDDSQLLMLGKVYNPFTNEWNEKPTEEIFGMDVSEDNTVIVSGYTVKDGPVVITKIEEKPTEADRIMEACKPYIRGTATQTIEKPNWYVSIEEMKKSEYWEVFKEWYANQVGCNTYKWSSPNYGKDGEFFFDGCNTRGTKLSPQQWYDTIYDGEKKCTHSNIFLCPKCPGYIKPTEWTPSEDHDKAMEIPEEEMVEVKCYLSETRWRDNMTKAIQQLQRIVFAHNNK